MWIRLRLADLATIVHYTGVFVVGVGLAMCVPLFTALAVGEWGSAMHYTFGLGFGCLVGMAMAVVQTRHSRIKRTHALMIAAFSWLMASVVAAVPLAFAPNYPTYLDALFDAMSGLTTSGLTVVVDLDHMAYAHNMWRHLLHLIGGQGIIVAALSFAIGLRSGALNLYRAEGRGEERVFPNVVNTARFIWFVTAVYAVFGTGTLLVLHLVRGMEPTRAVLQAFWVFVATYDTGGFAPQSMNALYYHSWVFDMITVALMMAGTLNFTLHAAVWRGARREIFKNLETRTLAVSIFVISLLVAFGLTVESTYTGILEVVRKGGYHVMSAHTGTGYQTLYPSQWSTQFGGLALLGVMIAMGLGGGMSSTAGGIKAMRVGLLLKAIVQNVRESSSPRSVVVQTRYHHIRDQILTPQLTQMVLIFFTIYFLSYLTGGIIGMAYGYPLETAMFESISATANVGLSMGITGADMPIGLKLLYVFQMWIGRLEFIAVFALIGHVLNALRPKKEGS